MNYENKYFLDQEWKNVCFMHWEVDKKIIASLIPKNLNIDLFENKAYIGVIPFKMQNVSPRWAFPLPFISSFPEFNIRTYVKYKNKRGVFFFTLDAQSIITCIYAPVAFGLPYHYSIGKVKRQGNRYYWRSRRISNKNKLEGSCEAIGQESTAKPNSIEYFFLERYTLFTKHRGVLKRAHIHHKPWVFQQAKPKISSNSFIDGFGFDISNAFKPAYCHISKGTKVKAWSLEVVN